MGALAISQVSPEQILCFFGVLVRFSVLYSVLPFVGDRMIPMPVKILLALATTLALFPALLRSGQVSEADAAVWGASAAGIVTTVVVEAVFGLVLGFVAKMLFDSIAFGANLVGNFMGFASAQTYDPHQESQTQIIAELQLAIAMLIFLVMDGHHLMLKAALDSYQLVGLGKATFAGNASLTQHFVVMGGEVLRFAVQLAAPVALSLFAVNVVFGVMAKAMPQLNILMLSFAVTALVGFGVMFLGLPEFQGAVSLVHGRVGDWMDTMSIAMAGR